MKDYNREMKIKIKNLGERKSLLLHSCCGPCSSAVIERLNPYFDITIFYYNPNILPKKEYEKRKEEQKRLLNILGIKFIEGDYEPEIFKCAIRGKEDMPEGSDRCKECYRFRLKKTAEKAEKLKIDFFTTTLSVSPHKNVSWINEILEEIDKKIKIQEPYLQILKKRMDICGR